MTDAGRRARVSAFLALSLDGYLATPEHGLEWLERVQAPDGEDYGYAQFMTGVDAVILGRNTFDAIARLGKWPFGARPVMVLTHRELPNWSGAVRWDGGIEDALVELERRGLRRVYLDGGQVIQQALRLGLLSDLTLSWVPVLLGRGISLFGELDRETGLQLVNHQSFSTGLVQVRYELTK